MTARDTIGVGVVGCGNISTIYLTNLARLAGLEVRAIADLNAEVARAQAQRFGVPAVEAGELLRRDDVAIVVNLTVPAAHADVTGVALAAGKHVFSEKPLATDLVEGRKLVEEAEARGLLLGCAPDTFLGPGGRLARRLLDEGSIGRIVTGTAMMLSHGMEHWHPNPEFFFKPGGGPVLDLGPYHIASLLNLLGPVASVRSLTGVGFPERLVTAPGPRRGQSIKVETPTTALALLEFVSGAGVLFAASWDVWRHGHPQLELYGTEGSIRLPDPNFFGGRVEISARDGDWIDHDTAGMAQGLPNHPEDTPVRANYRALGVAELADALQNGTPHRANGRLALHALEVMTAIVDGGEQDRAIRIETPIERPVAFSEDEAGAIVFAGDRSDPV